jgi:hypothetical protein
MRKLLVAACTALVFAPAGFAADTTSTKEPTAQQKRMTECNQKAGGMKGDERKSFMSTCLSGKAPEPKMTQQEKMKVCNQKAGEKKGDERKMFMSECLKG